MTDYRVKKAGDVLRLDEPLAAADPGLYVLLSVDDTCCLARVGEDRNGQICATNVLVDVEWADLSLFREVGMEVKGLIE